MAKDQFSDDFLEELFAACLDDMTVFDVCRTHLEYSYIPSEPHRYVWQEMVDYYNVYEKIPSLGILSEILKATMGVNKVLGEIKAVKRYDSPSLLIQLEEFLKMNMFVAGYDQLADLFNDGKKDQTYSQLMTMSEKIASFSITQSSAYTQIYAGWDDRHRQRIHTMADREEGVLGSLTLGIDALDHFHRGRLNYGDTVLLLAQSGVGKSLALRWIAMANARKGHIVVHFQGEDTKILCEEQYDSLWTGVDFDNISHANISSSKMKELQKALKTLRSSQGEIIVQSFETFGTASMKDCREHLLEIEKRYGKIGVIVYDYLEKFEPGDGKKYATTSDGERNRRRAIGDKMKNLSKEFNALGVTATQANNVSRTLTNDPNWYMTRENIAEFKAIVDPFSFFYTFNQTSDEYDNEIIRIYVDKMRKAKKGQLVPIYMNRDNGRFYNRHKTLEILWDDENKKVRLD